MNFRVVLDTNILISHLLFPGGNPSKIIDLAVSEKLTLVLSGEILDEMDGVLRNKFGYDSERVEAAREFLLGIGELAQSRHHVEVIRSDESDNRILECALSGKAHFLISSDKKHLLPLKIYKGIQILSPGEFIRDFVR